MMPDIPVNAVVVGGGFYGCAIAVYLAKQRGVEQVTLIERASALMTRASYNNQARVHNGYHYPRSFTTAFRSRVNLPNFVRDWPHVVRQDFTKLYAVAKRNSKVTARQFERFCRQIGAQIAPAAASMQALFEPRLIEKVYEVQEYAFDAALLAKWAQEELTHSGVEVVLNTAAVSVAREPGQRGLLVTLSGPEGDNRQVSCAHLFNCTYSGLNQLGGEFSGNGTALKHEITEMALMRVPARLKDLGITVMDGPFFSMMPFPAEALHTLSHVRYTPHLSWKDQRGVCPYARLDAYQRQSRSDRMVRDVSRYIPAMLEADYVKSLFEVKTVLIKNEGDDGRPILFEKSAELPGLYSVLGGKMDNIYDILEAISKLSLGGRQG